MIAGSRSPEEGRFVIRPLTRDDLEEVLLIEAASFPFPWLREMFEAELDRGDISRCYAALLPRRSGKDGTREEIVGYLMAWLVADEMQIINLAVTPSRRRSGAAVELLAHGLKEAAEQGAVWCQLEVRASNSPARLLYEKFGFRRVGIRKGYYQDGEDAVLMGKELGENSW